MFTFWRRLKNRISPPQPHIPESALGYAPLEHRHGSEWVLGWLFLDEKGFGFVAQLVTEPLFYIPYSSLIRYNYNRLYQPLPIPEGQQRRRARAMCFLRFHISDPQLPLGCLDFRGELESVQALDKNIRKLAFGLD